SLFIVFRRPATAALFPYTTLFRSRGGQGLGQEERRGTDHERDRNPHAQARRDGRHQRGGHRPGGERHHGPANLSRHPHAPDPLRADGAPASGLTMPLDPDGLQDALAEFFADPPVVLKPDGTADIPASQTACANEWGLIMEAYAADVVPPSATVSAAAATLASSLAAAFAT